MRSPVRRVHAEDAEAVELLLDRRRLTGLQTRGARPSLSITSATMGPLSLGRARFAMVGDLRGRNAGVVGVGRARAGRLSYTYADGEDRRSPGDLFVAVDPASEYVLHVEDVDVDHTMIEVGVFDQVVDPPPGDTVRLTGRSPVSPQAAATWMRTWHLVDALARDDGRPASDLVTGEAARLLAAVTLATFPTNVVSEPGSTDRRDARPAATSRAVAFIEANPDLDLGVADIARAARVSTRTLQLAFRRHLATTPTAYLKRVRLDRAHADLLASAPRGDETVTAIAARWGWARPSRFAADHRAAYGTHPSQVLATGP